MTSENGFHFFTFCAFGKLIAFCGGKIPVKKPGIQFNVIVLLCCGGVAAKLHCKGIQGLQKFLR